MNLYYGKFHALKSVNFNMEANRITAFIGPSGCGKSTLLKSLNRMNDLVEGCKITGDIRLDNEDIYGKARAWLAKSYLEAGWIYDAEDVIRNIERDSIHWRAQKEWDKTYALYYLKMSCDFRLHQDLATLLYSIDGKTWIPAIKDFKMQYDYRRFFMGTRIAIYNYATKAAGGYVDVDSFEYQKQNSNEK